MLHDLGLLLGICFVELDMKPQGATFVWPPGEEPDLVFVMLGLAGEVGQRIRDEILSVQQNNGTKVSRHRLSNSPYQK